MTPAPANVARIRAQVCHRHGCTHDASLSADLEASCPNGLWSAAPPGCPILIVNPRAPRGPAGPVGEAASFPSTRGKPTASPPGAPSASPFAAIPRDQWPVWAKAIALLAKPGDKGIGDVVASAIGPASSEAYKLWFQRVFHRPCGCAGRQAEWNARFRL